MTIRPCLECGTPTTATRCPDCEGVRQHHRNTRRAQRYGPEHKQTRKAWAPVVNTGTVQCARCPWLIAPGSSWHLDHLPDGTSAPSHARCNESCRADA